MSAAPSPADIAELVRRLGAALTAPGASVAAVQALAGARPAGVDAIRVLARDTAGTPDSADIQLAAALDAAPLEPLLGTPRTLPPTEAWPHRVLFGDPATDAWTTVAAIGEGGDVTALTIRREE